MFDTIGTLIGVATQANMLTEDGKLPRIKGALLADAIATIIGAIFGTSTTTTFAESAAGVSEGGRTGLTAITTGICFIVALVFYPLFSAIPSFATAPALIVVGCIMMSSLVKIKFENYNTAIPAYIAFLSMAALYSISEGISMGIISYTVLNTMYNIAIDIKKGDANKVTIHPLMYVLSLLFIIRYVVLG
jgi:AGZA family xanthine/uracil permease-like MFS transporter